MSETAPVFSNSDEMAKGKRKQCDQDSVGSEYESACAKRPRIEEISFSSENCSFPTDVNEQWDLIQTVPSVIEVNGVTIYDLDSKVLCILRSGTEIITENVCVFNTQCSEKAECRPMDSHSFETPPITENSAATIKTPNTDTGLATPSIGMTNNTAWSLPEDTDVQVMKPQRSEHEMTVNHATHYSGPMRPPFTHAELVEQALQEKGELTSSEILQWIMEHYPFYKADDDGWKRSIRQTLTVTPHFQKMRKAPHRAGHLWGIGKKAEHLPTGMEWKQHMKEFLSKIRPELEKNRASVKNQDLHTELFSLTAENCTEEGTSSCSPPILSPEELESAQ